MAADAVKRLPRSVDALRGLRAARWVRESTERQTDRFGPDAQREQQDRAIERYGLADTGRLWQVAHSGRTIASTAQFAEMLAAAGGEYDVLLVGYVSRFARDLRTAVNVRWVRALPELWRLSDPDQRRELVGLVYERIVVADGRFVEAIPTAYAMARGLPALLPERVDGGTGEPRRNQARSSHQVSIPVRGARAMRAALRARRTA